MTSDLCEEEVVRISSPQILSSEVVTGRSAAAGASAGVALGGGPGRLHASSAAVELGRRLLLAARSGDTPAVLDLMAKGAPFTTDWLGTSPLHLAAANNHASTCAVLLRAGVSRDSRTKVERTPLHLAAHAGHADVVSLLLDHGAIVDCRDMLRMTPLHWAAARGHAGAARELLRRGADPLARCKFRHTPRALALRHRHRALAALLLPAEEDYEAKKQLAIECANKERVDLKIEKPKSKPQLETMRTIKPEAKVEQPQQQEPQQTEQAGTVPGTEGAEAEAAGAEAAGAEASGAESAAAAALLRKHGITLLPTDDGSTVLNALQSGRTVVLSDAGKLMLKESGAGEVPSLVKAAPPKGVVLRATPVRTPPRGVKVFTLNNKLMQNKLPVRKVIDPHDIQQMKFVQLSSEAKVSAVSKVSKASPARPRPAVKIIMNKTNFNKLIAANKTVPLPTAQNGLEDEEMAEVAPALSTTAAKAAQSESASENRQLRAQLNTAHAALASMAAELRACKARLAAYEGASE